MKCRGQRVALIDDITVVVERVKRHCNVITLYTGVCRIFSPRRSTSALWACDWLCLSQVGVLSKRMDELSSFYRATATLARYIL